MAAPKRHGQQRFTRKGYDQATKGGTQAIAEILEPERDDDGTVVAIGETYKRKLTTVVEVRQEFARVYRAAVMGKITWKNAMQRSHILRHILIAKEIELRHTLPDFSADDRPVFSGLSITGPGAKMNGSTPAKEDTTNGEVADGSSSDGNGGLPV